jgi:hypothetical protein
VRAAALAALACVPCVAEGCYPPDIALVAPLHVAGHDVSEDNAAAAEAVWVQVGAAGGGAPSPPPASPSCCGC